MTFTIFRSVQELEVSTSESHVVSEAFGLSLMWRGKHSPAGVWLKRWKRTNWMKRLFTATFDPSRLNDFTESWTSFLEASRVSHFQALDSEKEPKTLGTCGLQSSEDSASAYLESLFSKTLTESSTPNLRAITAFSTMSLATWRSWVTEQQRLGSVREKSGRPTGDDGGSFSEFATPTAKGNQLSPSMRKHPGCAALWPTPRAMSGGPESAKRKKELGRTKSGGGCLQSAVRDWPTPGAADGKTGYQTRVNTGRNRKNLETIVRDTQTDPDPNTKTSRRVYLNPAWVETLMGFPIGWTDLEHWETQ